MLAKSDLVSVPRTIKVLGPGDAAAASQQVDDAGQTGDIPDAQMNQRIRIGGGGVDGIDLGQLGGYPGDVGDFRFAREAKLGERLDRSAELLVVEEHGESGEDADLFVEDRVVSFEVVA